MMVPTWELAHLVLVHAQLCFSFFKALFNGPTQPTQPHKRLQSRAERGIGNVIGIFWLLIHGSSNDQPHRFLWQAIVRENNPSFSELILNWPLGSFRYFSSI